MAVAAALDLDTMYVVSTRSRQIVRNLPCPEWDELQLRQVVWRSIPLAIVTFFLQERRSTTDRFIRVHVAATGQMRVTGQARG